MSIKVIDIHKIKHVNKFPMEAVERQQNIEENER